MTLLFPHLRPALTLPSAPVDLAQKSCSIDGDARDALSSLLNECCCNDILCSHLLTSHEDREDYDLRDARRDATFKHALNGLNVCFRVTSMVVPTIRPQFHIHRIFAL
jgi:hypothetical protein